MSLLDDVFDILEAATREEIAANRIEAATKFFEATYLMRMVLRDTPQEAFDTRKLLEQKIAHYSRKASQLYFDDSSMADAGGDGCLQSPASQLSQQSFFQEEVAHHRKPAGKVSSKEPSSSHLAKNTEVNQIASKANGKLARAIELDEAGETEQAIQSYMQSAELYLKAIRICEAKKGSTSMVSVLKRRLGGALDRLEKLKTSNGSRSLRQPSSVRTPPPTSSIARNSSSSFSRAEIDVLKRSSLIASGIFLPWSEEEAGSLSRRTQDIISGRHARGKHSFVDKDGDLKLSTKQTKHFHRWARPGEIARIRRSFGHEQHPPVMIKSVNPYSIRQQYVTDCSFISSLIITAAFEKKFRKSLITSIIYPQDDKGIPIVNPEGKYMVKLWLNGVARQVVIDDRLPIDRHSNLLCSHTTGDRARLELWVSIIEKAYMKLCGGYDFPGSNSGVDLFSLTGWIPERIFFPRNFAEIRDFETEPERAWDRLYSASSFGDCLITVSTTREISEVEADSLGLVTGHAYAVLQVFQARDGTRLLEMKNPWASKSWTGKYSPQDKESWANYTLRAEVGYNPDLAGKKDDGIFWISWEDVLRYFQNIQLSWNPALFHHHAVTHDFWPGNQGPQNDTFNIGENPQYVLVLSNEAIAKSATVWVLLSRHVTKQEQDGADVDDYLTIHLLRNNEQKERMWYPHGHNSIANGAYSNNPHVLVRYDVSGENDKYISLVLSQHQKSQDLGYTLSCFCTESFLLEDPQKDLAFRVQLAGEWTQSTAGGPLGTNEFFRNPLYIVNIPEKCVVQVRCSTEKCIAVNVIVLHLPCDGGGDYLRAARQHGQPILDSGNYRHGFAVTERSVPVKGTYALFVSTFYGGKLGKYHITIGHSCNSRVDVKRLQ